MPKLHVLTEGKTVITADLTAEHFTIGRNDDNSLSLDDRSVSKYHAMLIAYGPDYKLVDLNSRNGTFLNGERASESMLKDGDMIRVGLLELRFEALAASAAKGPARLGGPRLSAGPKPGAPTQTPTVFAASPAPAGASSRPLLRQGESLSTATAVSPTPQPEVAMPTAPAVLKPTEPALATPDAVKLAIPMAKPLITSVPPLPPKPPAPTSPPVPIPPPSAAPPPLPPKPEPKPEPIAAAPKPIEQPAPPPAAEPAAESAASTASDPSETPKVRTLLAKPAGAPRGEMRLGGPRKPVDAEIKKPAAPPENS